MPWPQTAAGDLETPVCIVGAGPAGTTTSLFLEKAGIDHVLVDKATFPRDKVCGDGLILHAFHVLNKLDPGLIPRLYEDDRFLPSSTARFHAASGRAIDLDFRTRLDFPADPILFARRRDFDHALVELLGTEHCTALLGTAVISVERSEAGGWTTTLDDGRTISSPLIVGADGIRSMVAAEVRGDVNDRGHRSVFVNRYCTGVRGLEPGNAGEVRLIHEQGVPLFFYIFPLSGDEANVSLGCLSHHIERRGINLRRSMEAAITAHPAIAPRFTDVTWGPWRGAEIPLGSMRRPLSAAAALLVGDAAGLANPFYKEGVGTGMMSGMIAADHLVAAVQTGAHDADRMLAYDAEVWGTLGPLLRYSTIAARMARHRRTFNLVVALFGGLLARGVFRLARQWTFEDPPRRSKRMRRRRRGPRSGDPAAP